MRRAVHVLVLASLLHSAACTSSPTDPADAHAKAPAAARGLPFSIERLSETFAARAAEVIAVRGYTYVRVVLNDGSERWIASLPRDIHVGDALAVRTFGSSANFESRQLRRTFPTLWFGMLTPDAAASSSTTSFNTPTTVEST